MKKIIIALLCATMLLSLTTVFASAEQTEEMKAYVGGIHYGEATVDGEKDVSYPAEPTIGSYVHTAGATYEEGKETSFDAYLLWDDYSFYGYIEVTDYSPVTYATEGWQTDCIQLYFIFKDWDTTIGSDDNIVGDANTITSVMFRCINASSKQSSALTDATFSGLSTLWYMIAGESRSQLVTKKTDTGYVYEFKFSLPDMITPDINRAGHAIGFGIQCNDDTNNDNKRDYIAFSSNIDQKSHGKTGKFILLNENGQVPGAEQDYMGTTGKDYVTEGPNAGEGTTAPETDEETNPPKTNAQTTTKAPTDAPANTTKTPTTTTAPTSDDDSSCGGFAGIWVALVACIGSAVVIVIKKK